VHTGVIDEYLAVVGTAAAIWWVTAPFIISVGDRRLKGRNPIHHKRLVRFHRAWGLLAIGVGAVISVLIR
jgi:hypothetical protein